MSLTQCFMCSSRASPEYTGGNQPLAGLFLLFYSLPRAPQPIYPPLLDWSTKSNQIRFPNLKPGRQLANGNHFLALFPCAETVASSDPSSVGVGGGGGASSLRGSAAEASAIGVGGRKPGRFRRFLSSLLTCSCLSSRRAGGGGGDNAGGEIPAVVDPNNSDGQLTGGYPQEALEEGVAVAGGVSGQWQGGGAESDAGSGLGSSENLTGTRGGGGFGGEVEWLGVSKDAFAARGEHKWRGVGWTRVR